MSAAEAWPPDAYHLAKLQAQHQYLSLMPELDRALWEFLFVKELVLSVQGNESHPALLQRQGDLRRLLSAFGVEL